MVQYNYEIDLANENSSHTKILGLVETGQRILEIGCATGYLTRYLKDKLGCTVFGVEIDAEAAKTAQPYCEEIIVGDIGSEDVLKMLSNQKFDVIMMADVIEHLKNPDQLLSRLKQFLKERGYILLSVPNGAHGAISLEILDGKWDYRKEGLLDKTHLHFFDKENLMALLEKTGLFISHLDRVVIHPRDTEFKTPWDSYPREVTAYIEKVNPEYKTYQFIIKAHPMTAGGWKKGLEDAVAIEKKIVEKLNNKITEYEKELSFLRSEYEGFQDELKKREKEYLVSWEKERERIENEKKTIHKDYRETIERIENETKLIHEGYQKAIADKEREIAAIHDGYRISRDTIENNYKAEIEQIVDKMKGERDEKEKKVQELKSTKDALNNKLTGFSESMRQLKNEYQLLQETSLEQRRQLDEVHNSAAWSMLLMYRRKIEKWLPEGTRRRRCYQLCINAPVVLSKEGIVAFFKRIYSKVGINRKTNVISSVVPKETKTFVPLTFPAYDHIKISIVIPVFNQINHTYRCLQSLLLSTTVPFEIIIYDNASTDETPNVLKKIEGITVFRDKKNLGFVEACNNGAAAARGDFILFLNNDTEVTDGWLESMLEPFSNSEVGIVGAKLIYPDGRLQEAGNVIWKDGSGWNFGRGEDPDLPQFCYRKAVDYCSAACLMIPKKIWNDVGGFDHRYAPAYYEDTDLCFSVREKGYKVVYQPEAKIIHYEGVTAGTDISKGFKSYQQKNLTKFLEKWQNVLNSEHFTGPEDIYVARERGFKMRALVIDHYVPTYDKDSGSLRMFGLLKILTEIGYKVTFWPENKARTEPYTEKLQQLGIEVIYGKIHFDEFIKENGKYIDLVILSRPHIAIQFINAVKAYTKAKIIYDTVDLHYLREFRRAELEAKEDDRLKIEALASEWKEKELLLSHQADVVLVVSEIEKELLEKENGLKGKVSVISNIHNIEPSKNEFHQRKGIMFIGGFVHQPNEDGIIWFCESIFPKLKEKISKLHLSIVGSYPTNKVKALSSSDITVTGYIPDVTPYFENSKVFICPLRYGAGVKGKIGQSLSYGLPVVTTAIGAEGIGLVDGKHAMIADDEETFASKVIQVYQDGQLWKKLSENGRDLINNSFSPDVIKEKLHLVCRDNVCR